MTEDAAVNIVRDVLSGIYLVLWVICLLKRRWVYGSLGLFTGVLPVVGAFRLGRPSSWFARRFYDEWKMREAMRRFPKSLPPPDWRPRVRPERESVWEALDQDAQADQAVWASLSDDELLETAQDPTTRKALKRLGIFGPDGQRLATTRTDTADERPEPI